MSKSPKAITHYELAVTSTGFVGLSAGIRLIMTGSTNFIIFEKATAIGGNWRDHTYSGCACDTVKDRELRKS